jgi:hypothetical protein
LRRSVVLFLLGILYLLHFDFWFWQRNDLILGLPVGLLYHGIYCLVVAAVLAWILRGVGRRAPHA